MTDAADIIRNAKPLERSVPICLAGDMVAQHEELGRQLAAAEREAAGAAASLSGSGVPALARQIAELEEAMKDHTINFRLKALPRGRWAKLVAAHPPRTDEQGKAADDKGFNTETFVDAVLRECIVSPELDDELFDLLVNERLSDGQYEQLTSAMWHINRSGVSVPFSRAASKIRQGSELG